MDWKLTSKILAWVLSWIGCLTSQLTIFQSYMWRHIDVQADWRRSWTYGRAPNAIDISVGFFNVPVLAPTRDHPFYTVIPTHQHSTLGFCGPKYIYDWNDRLVLLNHLKIIKFCTQHCQWFIKTELIVISLFKSPVRMPGVEVENTSSVTPACCKRRLNGAPLYSLSRWYGVKQ